MATPYDQFNKYLTRAQKNKLVQAQARFSNQHADERADLQTTNQGNLTQYRNFLANRGLSSAKGTMVSGEEARFRAQQAQQADVYNGQLKNVEDAQTANLAAQYAQQTKMRRAQQAAERAAQAKYEDSVRTSNINLDNFVDDMTHVFETEARNQTVGSRNAGSMMAYSAATPLDKSENAMRARAEMGRLSAMQQYRVAEGAAVGMMSDEEKAAYVKERMGDVLGATKDVIAQYNAAEQGYFETMGYDPAKYQAEISDLQAKAAELGAHLSDVTEQMQVIADKGLSTLTIEESEHWQELAREQDSVKKSIRENQDRQRILEEEMQAYSDDFLSKMQGAASAGTDLSKYADMTDAEVEQRIADLERQRDAEYYYYAEDPFSNDNQNPALDSEISELKTVRASRLQAMVYGYQAEAAAPGADCAAYKKYTGNPEDYTFGNSTGSKYYAAVNDNDTLRYMAEKAVIAKSKVDSRNADYYWVSDPLTHEEFVAYSNMNSDSMYYSEYAAFMTQEQRDAFNYIYNTEGASRADEYFDAIMPSLIQVGADRVSMEAQKFVIENGKFASWLTAIPMNFGLAASGAVENINMALAGRGTNKYTAYKNNFAQLVRNSIGKDYSEWGNFFYGTGTSMADSAVSALLSVGGTPLGSILLGMSAYNSTLADAYDRGLDTRHAQATAIVAGICEMFFEKYSLESLKGLKAHEVDGAVSWLKNTLKQAATEGSEEVFTDIGNAIGDAIINGDMSEYEQTVATMKRNGMSDRQARAEAAKNFGNQLLMSGLGGALSGGVMGGGVSAFNYMFGGGRTASQLGAYVRSDTDMYDRIKNHEFKDGEVADFVAEQDGVENLSDAELGRVASVALSEINVDAAVNAIKSVDGGIDNLRAFGYTDEKAQEILKQDTLADADIAYLYSAMQEQRLTEVSSALAKTGINSNKVYAPFEKFMTGTRLEQADAEAIAASGQGATVFQELFGGDGSVASILETANIEAAKFAKQFGVADFIGAESVAPGAKTSARSQFRNAASVVADTKTQILETRKGSVTLDLKNRDTRYLSNAEKAASTICTAVANATGVNVRIIDTFVGERNGSGVYRSIGETPRGNYDASSNTITIALDSDQAVSYVIGHELTHFLKDASPEAYAKYLEVVRDAINASTFDTASLDEKLRDKLEQIKTDNPDMSNWEVMLEYENKRHAGENLDKEGQADEVLAEVGSTMLGEEKVQKAIAGKHGLREKVSEFLNKIAQSLKDILDITSTDTTSAETQIIQDNYEQVQKIADAFAKMIKQAKKAEKEVKKAQKERAEKMQQLDTDASEPVQQSIRERKHIAETTMAEVDKRLDQAVKNGEALPYTREQFEVVAGFIDNIAHKIETEYKDKKDRNGMPLLPEEEVLSANIFPNGSYGKDAEPTTECFRQSVYFAMYRMVSDKLHRPLTNEEQAIVNQAAVEIGVDGPCIYCYSLLDRKAKEAYKLQYMAEREGFFKRLDRDFKGDKEAFRKARAADPRKLEMEYYKVYLSRVEDPSAYENGKYKKSKARKETASAAAEVAAGGESDKFKRVKLWLDLYDRYWGDAEGIMTLDEIRNMEEEAVTRNRYDSQYTGEERELKLREIDDMQDWIQASSQAKKIIPYAAYTNTGSDSILKWKQPLIDALNHEYGLRWYSHADFHPAFVIDNMQQFTDASVLGLKGLMYVKPIEAAKIFAPTGCNINVSCFADFKNGQYVCDDRMGADWEQVKALRQKYPNVGCVMVATNDDMVLWALSQDWVDVVIPLHLVRSGSDFIDTFGLTNYSAEQADKFSTAKEKKAAWEKYLQEIYAEQDVITDEDRRKARKDNKSIYPYQHQNNYDRYMTEINKRGLTPRFDRFRMAIAKGDIKYGDVTLDMSHYMKLVNETRQSDADTKPLVPVFDFDAAREAIAELEEKGYFNYFKPSSDWNGRTMTVEDWVDQAASDIVAGKKPNALGYGKDLQLNKDGQYIPMDRRSAKRAGVGGIHDGSKNSVRDSDYLALASKENRTEAEDAELQGMVEQAAKDAGYPYIGYHGTPGFGFTKFNRGDYAFFSNKLAQVREFSGGEKEVRPIKGKTDKPHSDYEKYLASNAAEIQFDDSIAPKELYDNLVKEGYRFENVREEDYWSGELKNRVYCFTPRGRKVRLSLVSYVSELYNGRWSTGAWAHNYKGDMLNAVDPFVGGRGIYKTAIKLDHPLVIDVNADDWTNIIYKGKRYDTNGLADYISGLGEYDGIILQNIVEGSGSVGCSTDYIVFNPSSIKSLDNVTYDDKGNIIPLSQRFNSENQDIRYSLRREQIDEIQKINKRSINELTDDELSSVSFMQQYWDSLGEKSPYYRAVNGEWRINDNSLVEIATDKGNERGIQINADTGWAINISGKVFNESKHKSFASVVSREYLGYLNDIVKKAILVDTEFLSGRKKSENSLVMHDFYAVVDIGNGKHLIKLSVEEMYDPNNSNTTKRAYKLKGITNRMLSAKGSQENSANLVTITSDKITVSDLFKIVNTLDTDFNYSTLSKNGKALSVRDNGNPLVNQFEEAWGNMSKEDQMGVIRGMSNKALLQLNSPERVFDLVSGGNKELRNWLFEVLEKPFNEAGGEYARGVNAAYENFNSRLTEAFGGRMPTTEESALIQRIGEGTYQHQCEVTASPGNGLDGTWEVTVHNQGEAPLHYTFTDRQLARAFQGDAEKVRSAAMKDYNSGSKEATRVSVNHAPFDLDMLKKAAPKSWENIVAAEKVHRELYDSYVDSINGMLESIYPFVMEADVQKEEDLVAAISSIEDRSTDQVRLIQEYQKQIQMLNDELSYLEKEFPDTVDKTRENLEYRKNEYEAAKAELLKLQQKVDALTVEKTELINELNFMDRYGVNAIREEKIKHRLTEINNDLRATNADIRRRTGVVENLKWLYERAEYRHKHVRGQNTKAKVHIESDIRRLQNSINSANNKLIQIQAKKASAYATLEEFREARATGATVRNKRLLKRDDYFHHFKQMTDGALGSIQNLFLTNNEISPGLAGISSQTKPNTKWTNFLQRRLGGEYTEDAVNGMYRYIIGAETILAYDPLIKRIRDVRKALTKTAVDIEESENPTGNQNANNFMVWLDQWGNSIAGKSHNWDRALAEGVGTRKIMQVLGALNGIVKKSKLLFNFRSAVVQVSNLTNAAGYLSAKDFRNGMLNLANAAKDDNLKAIIGKSNFLSQRFLDTHMELKEETVMGAIKGKPMAFAEWMLSAGDTFSAQLTWWSAYTQYARLAEETDKEGNSLLEKNGFRQYESAIDYADDITRRTHGGRGVGEVPIFLQSKIVNTFAPFQVEVLNTFENLTQQIGKKNALGIIKMEMAIFAVNMATRAMFGDGVLGFDFIHALIAIIKNAIAPDDEDDDVLDKIEYGMQQINGEIISGVPFAAQLASTLIPDEDARKWLFGEDQDPTRYGTGTLGLSSVADLVKLVPDTITTIKNAAQGNSNRDAVEYQLMKALDATVGNYMTGGTQLMRTAKGVSTWAKGYSANKNGRIQFTVDQDAGELIQMVMFGKWATQEGREYLGNLDPIADAGYEKKDFRLLSENQTSMYKEFVKAGGSGKDFFKITKQWSQLTSKDENGNSVSGLKKQRSAELLAQYDLTEEQYAVLWNGVFNYK